jgi:hypothetical protein
MSNLNKEELLITIEMQYRTIIQMNRVLHQMVEVARENGMVSELFKMQERVERDEQPLYEHRPILIL